MVTSTTKKTLIISVSAIVGITAISALVHLLIQDDRRAKHQRKIRALQKQLFHKVHKIELSAQELVESDIRLAQVRTRTLRTYPIFPGDPYVHPRHHHGIGEEDIQETEEELILESVQGYEGDPYKVRQAYKRLDFLVNSVNERLLRLLESLDAISPRELMDLGDVSGGPVAKNGPEMEAFGKVRNRKKKAITTIQQRMSLMDKVGVAFKDRLEAIEIYEKKEREAKEEREAAEAKEALDKKKEQDEQEEKKEEQAEEEEEEEEVRPYIVHHHHHVKGHAAESDLVKEGLSFAAVASHNTHTDTHHDTTHHEHVDGASITTTTTTTTTRTVTGGSSGSSETISISSSSSSSSSGETLAVEETSPHSDLEKMKAGITFADVAAAHSAEEKEEEEEEEDKLSAAVVEGVSFAEVAAAP